MVNNHNYLFFLVGSRERAISSMEVPVTPTSKPVSGATQTIAVTLVKGEKGLGFTITTRDNPTGGHCPIYIKNILPKVHLFVFYHFNRISKVP